MLFNSLLFLLSFSVVFLLYWTLAVRNLRVRNVFLLVCSYLFYASWDPRFLGLIVLSSVVDYTLGALIPRCRTPLGKRLCLFGSLGMNLGILALFKYFDFFAASFASLAGVFGLELSPTTLNLILPVGISFYTFQTLSYTLDIYRGELEPERDPVSFFAYVAFFPQLVAGPIERARNLLPQFRHAQPFDYATASMGCQRVLIGLFKKCVLADNLAVFVDPVFVDMTNQHPLLLLLAAIGFAWQIYFDFSGYSDMAIGIAGLLGFSLSENFRTPFSAVSITELWQRWHITLTEWLRDYLFVPLSISFRHLGRYGLLLNLLITFGLCGLWHGAAWNFVLFGLMHALILFAEVVFPALRRIPKLLGWLLTQTLWVLGCILFRCSSVAETLQFVGGFFDVRVPLRFTYSVDHLVCYLVLFGLAPLFLVLELWQKDRRHVLDIENRRLRIFAFHLLLLLFVLVGRFTQNEFIYFQF